MSQPTLAECIKCVSREMGMRARVYPRRVQAQAMSQEKADHEIACMERILEILVEMDVDDRQESLFEGDIA